MEGVDPVAWQAALRQLQAPAPHMRSEALDHLNTMLQDADWQLPASEAPLLVGALRERLLDSNWSVTQKCLLLIGELVQEVDQQLDALVGVQLLPGLVAKVSDSKVVVRKAASQALLSYMLATRDKGGVLAGLVRQGLESADWRQRQATLLFLSLPNTPLDGPASQLRELVRAVVDAILDPIEAVVASAQQALSRLKHGIDDFGGHIRALPPALRAAYEQREQREEHTEAAVDEGGKSELEFGFAPSRLMTQLRQVGNWQVRAQAIGELQAQLSQLDAEQRAQATTRHRVWGVFN